MLNAIRNMMYVKRLLAFVALFCMGAGACAAGTLSNSSIAYAEGDITVNLVYYDSRVGGGQTQLNQNTPCNFTVDKLAGTLKLQVNVFGADLARTYEPGDLELKVYGLEKFGLDNVSVSGVLFSYEHHAGTFDPVTRTRTDDYYIVRNKSTLNSGSSIDAAFQLVYRLSETTAGSPFNGSSGTVHVERGDTSSNELSFAFDIGKQGYRLYGNTTQTNVTTTDGFTGNVDDYYWLRTNYIASSTETTTKSMKLLNGSEEFTITGLPAGYRVLAVDYNSGVLEEWNYDSDRQLYYYNRLGARHIIIGAPKASTDIGDVLHYTINYNGQYYYKYGARQYVEDPETVASIDLELVVKDTLQPITGDVATLSLGITTSPDWTATNLLSRNNSEIWGGFSLSIKQIDPYYFALGVDGVYTIDSGGVVHELLDTDYYISSARIPKLHNANSLLIDATYDLYVKHRNGNYVLYKSGCTAGETVTFPQDVTDIIDAYAVSTTTSSSISNGSSSGSFAVQLKFNRVPDGYEGDGKIGVYGFLDVFDPSTHNSKLSVTEDNYKQSGTDAKQTILLDFGMPQRDIDEFGHLMLRDACEKTISPDKYVGYLGIKDVAVEEEIGYSNYDMIVYLGADSGSTRTASTILGYDAYVILPEIVNLNGTPEDIISNITSARSMQQWSSDDLFRRWVGDSSQFSTVQELCEYMQESMTIDISSANGQTIVHIGLDFDEPLELPLNPRNGTMFCAVPLPITIYDSDVLDYGSEIYVEAYAAPKLPSGIIFYDYNANTNLPTPNFAHEVINPVPVYSSDINGKTYPDTIDVDGDGNVTERFNRFISRVDYAKPIEALQEVMELTQIIDSTFTNKPKTAVSGREYTYRLRVRTASTGMTNLVLYTNLEAYAPAGVEHWQGSFVGVDLVRSEAQHHVPTVYWSPSPTAGKLGEDDSWQLLDDSVDVSLVKSLAFDYEDQVIPSGTLASVDITMLAPTIETDNYAYNMYSATWQRVDPVTGYVYPSVEEQPSNVTVIALDKPVAETKNITVQKIWDNEGEGHPFRPESVTVKLLQDGEQYGDVITLTEANNWSITITGLPWFDDDAHEYIYTLEELPVSAYSSAVNGYSITNTFVPEPAVTVTKTADKTSVATGDVITYTITVENTGNIILAPVTITDSKLNITNETIAASLAPGEEKTITRTYTVTEADAAAGSTTNTVSATGTPPTGIDPPVPATDYVTTPVIMSPALAIEKSVLPTSMNNPHKDDTVTWAIKVTNTGDVTVHDIAITDALLTGRNIAVALPQTTLAPNASSTATITMPLTQSDINAGSVTNTASASGKDPANGNVASGEQNATVTLTRNPGLSVTKSVDKTSAHIGDTLAYTLVVKNTGNTTLSNVKLSDVLTGTTDQVVAATLEPNASQTVNLSYTPVTEANAIAGSVKNTATATATSPGSTDLVSTTSNEVTTTITSQPALTIDKTVSPASMDNPHKDDTVTWSFKVKNTGDITLNAPAITDALLTARNITLPSLPATLAPNAEVTVTATMPLTQADIDAGSVTNVATVSATDPSTNQTVTSPEDTAEVTLARNAAFTVAKTVDKATASVGDELSYTITVTNTGNVTLTNIKLNDALVGLSNYTLSETLDPGTSANIVKKYTSVTEADAVAGSVVNTVTAAVTPPTGVTAPDPQTATATTTIAMAPAISIEKTVNPASLSAPKVGDTVTWNFTIRNTGDVTLSNVAITDAMLSARNLTATPSVQSLAPNATATASVTMELTQEDIDAGQVVNTAKATAKDPSNTAVESSEATATVTLSRNPALSVAKSVDKSTAHIGDTLTYTITITNTGNTTLSNVKLSDVLTNTTNQDVIPSLAPNASKSVELTYTPVTEADAIAGSVKNTATATATSPGSADSVNATSNEVSTTITSQPAITIEKTVSPASMDTPKKDDTVTWSFKVKNTGDITLNAPAIADALLTSRNITIPTLPASLAPNAETTVTATMPLTQADVNAGSVLNAATVSATDPSTNQTVTSPEDTAEVTLTRTPAMSITKTVDKETAGIGDELTYTITVTNTGNVTLTNVKLNDVLLSMNGYDLIASLDPGASANVVKKYTSVTEADAVAGSVVNTAIASASVPTGVNALDPVSATATTTITMNPELTIEKTVEPTSMSAPKTGDKVTWNFTITNSGDVEIHDISVVDAMLAARNLTATPRLTTLAAGASTTASVEMELTQQDIDAGKVDNVATATGKDPLNAAVTSEEDNASVTLTRTPALTVEKSVDKRSANIGDTLTYTITVTNTGNVTLAPVTVSDPLCNVVARTVSDSLAPGATASTTCSYGPVTEADAIAKNVVNTASAHATPPIGVDPPQDPADTVTTPVLAHPSIKITKTASPESIDPAKANDTITWSFEVENTGDITLSNIAVADPYLTSLNKTVTVSPTTLAPGAKATATVQTAVSQTEVDAGIVENTATASGTEPVNSSIVTSDPDTVQVELVRHPALSVKKTADKESAGIGDTITYTITVTNTGNTTLTNVTYDDPLTGKRSAPVVDTLASGASATATCSYGPVTEADAVAKKVTNTATAHATPPTGTDEPQSPSDTIETPVTFNPSISIEKTVSPQTAESAHEGDEVEWTFVVTNTGDITLSNVVISDPVLTARNITVPAIEGTLAPDASTTVKVKMALTQQDIDAGKVVNTATVSGKEPVDDTTITSEGDEETVSIVRNPALSIEKTVDKDTANIGDALTYTVTVTNTGNVTLTDVGINDARLSISNRKIADSLAPGEHVSVTLTYDEVTEADAIARSVVNTATAYATPPAGAPTPQEPSDSVTTEVVAHPSIAIDKDVTPTRIDPAHEGDAVTWSFEVTNTGDITLSQVSVADEYLEGLGKTVALSSTTLAPGAKATATVVSNASQAEVDAGIITNTAIASGTAPIDRMIVTSEPDSASVELVRHAELDIEKSVDKASANIGDTLTYTVVVTNTGNVTLSNIKVNDPLIGKNNVVVVDSLLPGASTTVNGTYGPLTEEDALAKKVTNVAVASATAPAGVDAPTPPNDSVETAVVVHPSIKLVKTANPTAIENARAGAEITWSFDVTNTGDISLNGLTIADAYLSGKGIAISLDKDVLAPGQTAHATAKSTLSQADVNAGRILNEATAYGYDIANSSETTDDDDAEVVLGRAAALSLVHTVDKATAHIGDKLVYTIEITNTGNVTLTDVTFDMPLLDIMQDAVASKMEPGEKITLTREYTPVTEDDAIAKTVDSTVTAHGKAPAGVDDPRDPSDSVSTAILSSPAVTIEKSVDQTKIENAKAGDEVTWSFVVKNTGDITISNVAIEDELLADRNIAATPESTSLAPGASTTATAQMEITQEDINAGLVVNMAKASATEPVENITVASAPAIAQVEMPPASGIEIAKSVDKDKASIGDELTYTITVTNTGNTTVTDVKVTDALIGVEEEVVAESLAPGENATIEGTYTVVEGDAVAGNVENTALVEATAPDGTYQDTDTVEVEISSSPSISVVKTSDKQNLDPVAVGDVITWIFDIENTGDLTLDEITIVDEMLANAGIEIETEQISLAPGETMTYKATYKVTQEDIDAGSIENTAYAIATTPTDTRIESDPSTATVKLRQHTGLVMEKNVSQGRHIANAVGGESLAYTMKVTNNGNTTLENIEIKDDMKGLKDLVIDWSSKLDADGTLAGGEEGTLAPGESVLAYAAYTLTIDDISRGYVDNVAYALAHTAGESAVASEVVSNESKASVAVTPAPETAPLIQTGDGVGTVLIAIGAAAGVAMVAGGARRARRKK